jgi:hypothetical protein
LSDGIVRNDITIVTADTQGLIPHHQGFFALGIAKSIRAKNGLKIDMAAL